MSASYDKLQLEMAFCNSFTAIAAYFAQKAIRLQLLKMFRQTLPVLATPREVRYSLTALSSQRERQCLTNRLKQAKENVGVNGAFMGLVQHDDRVLRQVRVNETFSQQHTIRHVLDHCLGTRTVLKTDRVAHLTTFT